MNIKGDLTGGLIAGIVALPLALAFGIASGLGASAGLWGAIVLGFFAAVFGGTKLQISGPTGPMTVVSTAVVLHFNGNINAVMAVFSLAGLFQILFSILHLGKFVKYIPYSVVSGFMTGVGVIIILLELNPMLGIPAVGSTIAAIKSLPTSIANFNPISLVFTLSTLTMLYLTPRKITYYIPASLLAIVVLTFICAVLNPPIATIGEIPTGFPNFIVPRPDTSQLGMIVMYALMLATLGAIDSLLTSLVADSTTKTKHEPNRELFGQGIGNTLVGFVGGIPGAGATMRTVANIKAGSTSRLSGVTHSLFLLFVVLIFAPVVKYVPLPVLAGILIKVGIDILDYRLLKRVVYIPQKDVFVMVLVFLLTVLVDLILAAFVGIFIAWILYMSNIPKRHRKFYLNSHIENGIQSIYVGGPVYFGTGSKLIQILSNKNMAQEIIIDLTKVTFIDISAIYVLEDFVGGMDKNKTKISLLIDEKTLKGRSVNELKYVLADCIVTT